MTGLVLLDKPAGVTSFAALGALKRALGSGRVGHAGTLDPFATGLLVALTGPLTRLADVFSGLDKVYRAVLRFGEETDTLDPEGQVVDRRPLPDPEALRGALGSFRGRIEQRPPAYSAVHVSGRRAYALAREGRPPELPARTVTIHSLQILHLQLPEVELEVRCSKGTYVRSLARDLARQVGSCAHLRALRRLAIGPFLVEQAVAPEQFRPERDLLNPSRFLPELPGLRCLTLRAPCVPSVRQGRPMRDSFAAQVPEGGLGNGTYGLLDPAGELVALARRSDGVYAYTCVL